MQIQDHIDMLRGRFVRYWRAADEKQRHRLTINRNTLTRFLRGDSVTQDTLEALDTWCDSQEALHGHRV